MKKLSPKEWWRWHKVLQLNNGGIETRIQFPNHIPALHNNPGAQAALIPCSRFPWQPCGTNHPLWVALTHSCFLDDSFFIMLFFSLRENTFAYTFTVPKWTHSWKEETRILLRKEVTRAGNGDRSISLDVDTDIWEVETDGERVLGCWWLLWKYFNYFNSSFLV